MKILSTFLLLAIALNTRAQKQVAAGLVDLEPEGIVNIITDITISPNNKSLFLSGAGGRAYLFDISIKGKTKQIWKNNEISGMASGSICRFSADGQYIFLRGMLSSMAKTRQVMFSKFPRSWQNTDDACVLDAATGKLLLKVSDAYSISVSANTAFVSDKEGFKWFSLPDGKLIKTLKVEDNEYAAISPSGKYIVESWDADKQAFKDVASVVRRRTELKNAYRAKKLLVIYEAANPEKAIAYSNDEMDVATNMQFSPDEKYVYVQTQLAGEENSTTPNPYVFQRVELATGIIDKSFGIKGNYCKMNFSTSRVSSLVAGGNIGMLKEARIQNIDNSAEYSSFETRIKLLKFSTLYTPVAMADNSTTAYLYYEKQLFEWDYTVLKKYFKKAAAATDEELATKADNMLDEALENPNSKLYKDIKKLGITGEYIMDITISGPKGAVTTVFCESDEKTNIPMQNALKDLIRKQEFDLGLPKEKRLKFRYSFQL